MKTATRAAAVTAASLLACAAWVPTAGADTGHFADGGDHLTTVVVDHGSKVKVTVDVGPMELGSYFSFWIDTDPDDAGPEYATVVYPNSDGPTLMRVDSFTDPGTAVDCDDFRATADVYGPEEVTITVPRGCLGKPAKLRVSVRGYYEVPGPNIADWAPAKRTFFGWVAR